MLIFVATYLVLAIGRLPGFRVDRTGAAIIGASLMVGCNVIPLHEAYRAIDWDTIILLFGMMIVVANLRLSGFFAIVSEWVVEHAHRPVILLISIVGVSGFFSAFFVNDTMCMVMTPLVLDITASLRRNPVPYLLAVAMASNVGSVATITGNPQNMLIGSFSGIPYRRFAAALTPAAVIGLVLTAAAIYLVYRREFQTGERVNVQRREVRVNAPLLWKSVAVSAGMIAFFFAGWPVPKVALVAGAILLLTRRVKPEKVYAQVDFALLALFAGLFVVVAGMKTGPLEGDFSRLAARAHLERPLALSALAALLSNLVSNVPAVLVFAPFVARLADPQRGWLALAMSSTLAGNLTVMGSVANLIVLQRARHAAHIGFWEYARVGIPLTAATVLAGALLL